MSRGLPHARALTKLYFLLVVLALLSILHRATYVGRISLLARTHHGSPDYFADDACFSRSVDF